VGHWDDAMRRGAVPMTTNDFALTLASIKEHEGFSAHPTPDTDGTLTVGYGRNLMTDGVTEAEADVLAQNTMTERIAQLTAAWPTFATCDGPRQRFVLELAYQCGTEGALGFKDTLHAIAVRNFPAAVAALLNSDLARTDPGRVRDYIALLQEP
jgi:GH24 family phage-related lysozyme (muramidase)